MSDYKKGFLVQKQVQLGVQVEFVKRFPTHNSHRLPKQEIRIQGDPQIVQ